MGRCVCVEALALSLTPGLRDVPAHTMRKCVHMMELPQSKACAGEGTMCVPAAAAILTPPLCVCVCLHLHLHLHRLSPWIQLLKVAKCLVI